MEPGTVWAGPSYFIAPTSLLEGMALNWRKREHDAELPLFCSVFSGEQRSQQSSVWAVQLGDLYIMVFVLGLRKEHGWRQNHRVNLAGRDLLR